MDKAIYDCKRGFEKNDREDLSVAKDICDGKEKCEIIAERSLFGNSKCSDKSEAEMELWAVWRCEGNTNNTQFETSGGKLCVPTTTKTTNTTTTSTTTGTTTASTTTKTTTDDGKDKGSKKNDSKEKTSQEEDSKENTSKEDDSKEKTSKEENSKEKTSKEKNSKEKSSKEDDSKEKISKEEDPKKCNPRCLYPASCYYKKEEWKCYCPSGWEMDDDEERCVRIRPWYGYGCGFCGF